MRNLWITAILAIVVLTVILDQIFLRQKGGLLEHLEYNGTIEAVVPVPSENKPVTDVDMSQIAQTDPTVEAEEPNATIEEPVTSAQEPKIEEKTDENMTLCPVQPTVAERLSELGAHMGDQVFIRIFKQMAELEVWIQSGGRFWLLQRYTICRQSGFLGPKLKEGDKQGPEGFYSVTKKSLNPNSRFHLSFDLGYPNQYDIEHGRTGSALMIHGDCVSVGCFAMTDAKIDEIYELVESALEHGQEAVQVHIFPFRMGKEAMIQYRYHRWYGFWENLKEGYDAFEAAHLPPMIEVKRHRYVFSEGMR
jgi:murein L,D-transpeptidase YafK